MPGANDVKSCPFCAEEIKIEAVKCRFCGEWLDQPSRDENNKLKPNIKAKSTPSHNYKTEKTPAKPEGTWVARMCRRSVEGQLLGWGAGLAVILIICAINCRYIYNFLCGPFPIQADDLERAGDSSSFFRYFVQVVGTDWVKTGIQEVRIRGSDKSVSANFYGLRVGDKLLLVKTSAEYGRQFNGRLTPLTEDLKSRISQGQLQFYECYLDDTESFRAMGYAGVMAGVIFLAFMLVMTIPAWRIRRRILWHPAVTRVSSWGNLMILSDKIEAEYKHPIFRVGDKWNMGEQYLVLNSRFEFGVFRFEDLLWAYKHVTKRSVNFIPVGNDYKAILIFYDGTATIQGSGEEVEKTLTHSAMGTPGINGVFKRTGEIVSETNQRILFSSRSPKER